MDPLSHYVSTNHSRTTNKGTFVCAFTCTDHIKAQAFLDVVVYLHDTSRSFDYRIYKTILSAFVKTYGQKSLDGMKFTLLTDKIMPPQTIAQAQQEMIPNDTSLFC